MFAGVVEPACAYQGLMLLFWNVLIFKTIKHVTISVIALIKLLIYLFVK